MSVDAYERYVLGFIIKEKEYKKYLGVKTVKKDEPRYDVKTGKFSHYEKVNVKIDDFTFSLLDIENSDFDKFIKALDLKIQEILGDDSRIEILYPLNEDVKDIYIGHLIYFPVGLKELNDLVEILQILLPNKEIKIHNYTEWM